VPEGLRGPLLLEFNKQARNFRERRWEPAELNGGKLCEIVYSILKGYVDGAFPKSPSKPANMVDACRQLEKASGFSRSIRVQIPRMLVALYEIRNNRNVGHVGSDVDPNHMDATVVLGMSQWIMAELVRTFHDVSTEVATAVVDQLVERTVPLIWKVGSRTKVLDPKMSSRDKAFVLLYAAPNPLTVLEIVNSIEYSNASQFRTKVLAPAHRELLIDLDKKADLVTLSPLGARLVEDTIQLNL
jgi:hypothetical protein